MDAMSKSIRACLLAVGLFSIAAAPALALSPLPEPPSNTGVRQHLTLRAAPAKPDRQRRQMMKLHMLLMQLGALQQRLSGN
ncbi:MAG: hypothetical protein ACR2PM_04970 [Hyphomicrobiales bacterium]